ALGSRGVLTFSFVSRSSEVDGLLITLVAVVSALVLMFLSSRGGDNRWSGRRLSADRPRLSNAARQLALGGVLLLAIAAGVHTISWFGIHPVLMSFSILDDPYGADQFYLVA